MLAHFDLVDSVGLVEQINTEKTPLLNPGRWPNAQASRGRDMIRALGSREQTKAASSWRCLFAGDSNVGSRRVDPSWRWVR